MNFHVVVEVNGKDCVFVVDADNEVDAQHLVYHDIRQSIEMKSCTPLTDDKGKLYG